ncbi:MULTISPECIES: pyridoxal phosphate-dependent decarboxylase family protein [Nocardiopsidaceae]|uniref:Aspartate aminotransferase family protein n=1 Tax=Streptomonospora nanhaiensis TaxID=1323731 RepID=A0ABY6YRH0_9ACTN|nr:aspartate aminotransferase family protein [Streptomonospora nanhaiensis]WAE74952.1 aspartate aminotransferase family protein [Streptomonospora nanhaiensis]
MNFLARSVQDPPTGGRGSTDAGADDAPDTPPVQGTDHRAHLFDAHSAERYRVLAGSAVDRVAARIARVDRPFTGATAEDLRPGMDKVDLDRPLDDPAAALDELEHLYLDDAVYFHHPRYMGHLNCPVVLPALLGETVLSAVNSSLDTWDQSAGGTLIEQRLIDWTAGRIGFGEDADGVFTSGGSQSNLQALLMARDEAHERHGGRLSELLPRMRVLTSEAGHFSVAKSAALLGLGYESVITVACDDRRRMRPDALAAELRRCLREDLIPVAVVATAGTTDFGSIDPLPRIADLCSRHGLWMHVDAAYGCGLLVSRHRHLLSGVERADSVTVDFHKSFFQPVSSSAVVVREGRSLRHVTYHADYLNSRSDGSTPVLAPNQVDKSLQTTRRFDALKLWLTLRTMGAEGVGALFDSVLDLAAAGWSLLDADPRFTVVTRPTLSTLVFRCALPGVDEETADGANRYAREALLASGRAVAARTTVDGRPYLKLTLLNPRSTREDVAEVLDLLAGHARHYAAEHGAVARTGGAPSTAPAGAPHDPAHTSGRTR